MVAALGSRFGGWSLYLDEGRPVFVFARSTDPTEIARVEASGRSPGASKLRLRFASQGPGKGAEVVAQQRRQGTGPGQPPTSLLTPAGDGETLDIGRDLGVPVTEYRTPQADRG